MVQGGPSLHRMTTKSTAAPLLLWSVTKGNLNFTRTWQQPGMQPTSESVMSTTLQVWIDSWFLFLVPTFQWHCWRWFDVRRKWRGLRNTDQEEHPLLVTLPGELLEAPLSHKLPTGLDQIVISNLEVRTNLNSRQQLGNNIISGNFLYIYMSAIPKIYTSIMLKVNVNEHGQHNDVVMFWWNKSRW